MKKSLAVPSRNQESRALKSIRQAALLKPEKLMLIIRPNTSDLSMIFTPGDRLKIDAVQNKKQSSLYNLNIMPGLGHLWVKIAKNHIQ